METNQAYLYYLPETARYSKMGLTLSEEYVPIAEDIAGLDYCSLHHNETVHELLICDVHIQGKEIARDAESGLEMYVELLRHLDNDHFLVSYLLF